jgi:serine/threonine protein kinase
VHSKGVCHLDIKPDNMLLSSSCTPAAAVGARWFPTVKLADFGMAAHAPVRRTVGTLFYVAPEILTEGYADQASDMWRCVCVCMCVSAVPAVCGACRA